MTSRYELPTLAKTVACVVYGTDILAARIRDRSSPLTAALVNRVTSLPLIGYPGRRPRARVDCKGQTRPTDMDLASFLVSLLDKPTIIELPAYTAGLPRSILASERHLSSQRYGQLLALSSHREYLSFGVTIEDMSIMRRSPLEEDCLGAPRTFNIVTYDGSWHQGWQGISWQFRKDEFGFRERYDLLADSHHQSYQYFVHPNRRQSIFSRAHLLLKLLVDRIDDELQYWSSDSRPTIGVSQPALIKRERGKHVLVPTFVMRLTGLPLYGSYPPITDDTGEQVRSRIHFLTTIRTKAQFLVRVNEYAFYQYGREHDYVAHWIRGGQWHHFGQTSQYRRHASLVLTRGVSLGYTADMVSKKVAAH
jgi:hypothetical protein